MATKVIQFRGVRKPSLVLIKGGRGKVATPPLTDAERYPRFPPAWVDWLVLGVGLAGLNFPSPVPIVSVACFVVIELLVARRIKQEGGEDPNIPDGVTMFFSSLFIDIRLRKPLERKLPSLTPFTKQVVVFTTCEIAIYVVRYATLSGFNTTAHNFLTISLFLGISLAGLKVLMWWDTPN